MERFDFGENWNDFLYVLDDDRIRIAEDSLKEMLGIESLEGKTFLDIGSGSGLFSLAAIKLGAAVRSFDYDPKSVACTQELKRRYFKDDVNWIISDGDVLNKNWLSSLGQFDIVYSWGVLHHTGAMWDALSNVHTLVKQGGSLFISIYNDQGNKSRKWKKIKRRYAGGGGLKKFLIFAWHGGFLFLKAIAVGVIKHKDPFFRWKTYKEKRGMSFKHDVIDWIGGYPFEVAKPEEIFDFFYNKGYQLHRLYTAGAGHGCNQFVFHLAHKGTVLLCSCGDTE
jgi:2-polyprenyl-6-hydroxyphenyl methylase/3-demethylubiquinone-9 3-methyltransferase